MKNFIFALVASLVLPIFGFGQNKIKQDKETYYHIPVPEDLQTTGKDGKQSKIAEFKIHHEKVNYLVRIKYNPVSKKESVYSIEITSESDSVNKKLSKMSSNTGKPGSLSACYSGEKQTTPDWQALADCVVIYVQAFL
ncbi:MAG: hypothetical protein WCY25_06765 [Moheibacter sp.]